eukprot:4591190-Alexandrium_andersonii.AAC.1
MTDLSADGAAELLGGDSSNCNVFVSFAGRVLGCRGRGARAPLRAGARGRRQRRRSAARTFGKYKGRLGLAFFLCC